MTIWKVLCGRNRVLRPAGKPGFLGLWLAILAACVLGAFLLVPRVISLYHIEVGGRALERARAFHAARPHDVNPMLDRALTHLQRAVAIAPRNGYAHRRLGQAWLLLGNNEAARDALRQAAALRPHNPLIRIELGYAYDGLGQVDQALAAYERGGYGPAAEAAVVNMCKVADWQSGAGAGDDALQILQQKALPLAPDNLAVLVRMLHIYERMGEQAALAFAQPLRERLRDMPAEEVVLPAEPRLMAYVEEAIAALVEEGIWTEQKAGAVLAR
jgi:tetratricopeptide (TPR) repeat protein